MASARRRPAAVFERLKTPLLPAADPLRSKLFVVDFVGELSEIMEVLRCSEVYLPLSTVFGRRPRGDTKPAARGGSAGVGLRGAGGGVPRAEAFLWGVLVRRNRLLPLLLVVLAIFELRADDSGPREEFDRLNSMV
ncbi:hypothetical protein ABL78_4116 [Leptomonas seymouri]|uniref:Uncharacterized protein n=1 Tax=Leptomonas seymouri TaxID=5684 RepID=A0A0N0P5T5_LEPSE|nr:hypothetical protein ABL78_4116 [Leptomonas seymouri]|eukprot:KPI86839.1 hypothetical protein ABL78_4116 [Leptomonas seymouri]